QGACQGHQAQGQGRNDGRAKLAVTPRVVATNGPVLRAILFWLRTKRSPHGIQALPARCGNGGIGHTCIPLQEPLVVLRIGAMAEGQLGEFSMRKIWLGGVMSAALLCSTGMVLAQTVLEITPQQERTVY